MLKFLNDVVISLLIDTFYFINLLLLYQCCSLELVLAYSGLLYVNLLPSLISYHSQLIIVEL